MILSVAALALSVNAEGGDGTGGGTGMGGGGGGGGLAAAAKFAAEAAATCADSACGTQVGACARNATCAAALGEAAKGAQIDFSTKGEAGIALATCYGGVKFGTCVTTTAEKLGKAAAEAAGGGDGKGKGGGDGKGKGGGADAAAEKLKALKALKKKCWGSILGGECKEYCEPCNLVCLNQTTFQPTLTAKCLAAEIPDGAWKCSKKDKTCGCVGQCTKCASLADCAGLVDDAGKPLVPTKREAIEYRNSTRSEAKKAYKDYGCEGYKASNKTAAWKTECEDLDKSVVKTEAAYNAAVAANEPEDSEEEESSAITATASFVVVAAVAMLF